MEAQDLNITCHNSKDSFLSGVGPMTGVPMSHVDFKKCQCRMSLSLIYAHVKCRI